MAGKRARHLSHSRGKAKAAAESYSHMMGSPQDPASVGMNQMPSPQGGAFSGQQLQQPGPMAPGIGA